MIAPTPAALFFATLAIMQFPENSPPIDPPSTLGRPPPPSFVMVAGSIISSQVKSKVTIISRKRRGDEMEVRFRIEFNNLSPGNRYKMFFLTGYMENNGLPEVDLSKQFGVASPGKRKTVEMEYGALLYRGEWIRIRLRSLDGKMEKSVRFVLYE